MQVRASSLAAATGGGLGSALVTVEVWLFQLATGVNPPVEVVSALGVIETAMIALIVAAFAPLTQEKPNA